MKKIIASITIICYLALTTGVIVNFHYCMDRLGSVQLFAAESKKCSKCGMHIAKSHGCCRDEVKIIKMELDQKAPLGIAFDFPALEVFSFSPSQFISASFFTLEETGHYKNHSPPLISGQDTYLQNCVFRI